VGDLGACGLLLLLLLLLLQLLLPAATAGASLDWRPQGPRAGYVGAGSTGSRHYVTYIGSPNGPIQRTNGREPRQTESAIAFPTQYSI
jgi:hypothetical protein